MAIKANNKPKAIPASEQTHIASKPSLPAQQDVREKAYEIYRSRDGQPGNAELDWCEAERLMRPRGSMPRSSTV